MSSHAHTLASGMRYIHDMPIFQWMVSGIKYLSKKFIRYKNKGGIRAWEEMCTGTGHSTHLFETL